VNKKTSLKDIAQKLGVSTALVSYVVNGKAKQARVGDVMAERIRNTAVELNYLPNQVAKSLRSGRTQTIGLVVADISNPFFSALARIIEDEAAKHGYVVVFGSSDENANKSAKLIEVFINRQMDALIIAPAANTEDQLLSLQQKKIPFVLVDRCPKELIADMVEIDNEAAAAEATQYLIEKGASKIAMLAYDSPLPHMQARIKGYEKTLQKSGLKSRLKTIRFEHLQADIDKGLNEIASAKVDGLLFATNTLATEGLKKMKKMDLVFSPEIVSFDQSDMFEILDHPPVFVQQPLAEMGKKAVELAIAKITNQDKENERVVFNTILVEMAAGKIFN
jgi:LacI family transcriptional regulator